MMVYKITLGCYVNVDSVNSCRMHGLSETIIRRIRLFHPDIFIDKGVKEISVGGGRYGNSGEWEVCVSGMLWVKSRHKWIVVYHDITDKSRKQGALPRIAPNSIVPIESFSLLY